MLLSANLVFMSIIAISFGIFIAIMYYILFLPISRIIEKREEFFARNATAETALKEKAKDLIEQKEKAILDARFKASNFLKQVKEDLSREAEFKIKEIKKEVLEKAQENHHKLEEEYKVAKNEIKTEISTIVNSIATKILNEDINIELEEEKIKDCLNI